ncbi:lipopolysaccharide transport periplasmic protein LptA [Duganella sp. FT109W]|uniref:Lipopolysaccharide transport periplasmic protein LptA n=1 Tax=Duganella margarita TaxID=2692170 RepID=A0ABW9WIS3_9BURK|nr:lipopolysaccharide transport periplasmic protein LptA [Duganella margarita]MYN41004.1 lipopolysaccharide transport periplasmic protein LptA [Duganella margarita]
MKNTSLLLCSLLLGLSAAHAERADSFQKTVVRARDASGELTRKVTTLTGNIEIQRGTLLIRAEHGVMTEDAQGYQHIVLSTKPGEAPVFFRQRRDGGQNVWMEGEALEVVYDEKAELVDLIDHARVRRTTEGALTDEVVGEHIIYNSREEQYQVTQLANRASTGDRRGTMVLQPTRKDPLISPASATASMQ